MKTLFIVISLLLVGCTSPGRQKSLPVSDVEEGKTILMGRLGRPLGTVCTIEAVVVEVPPKMRTFGDMGRHYGLRIDKIDGTKLQIPIVSRFDVHYYAPLVKLAPNDSELDSLIIRMSRSGEYLTVTQEGHLTEAEPISLEDAQRFRVGYVGSRHTLLVYETAEYWGAPKDVPKEYGFVFNDAHRFHFAAHLVVFAEIAEEAPIQPVQHNAGSRPVSAVLPVFASPSLLGPRG